MGSRSLLAATALIAACALGVPAAGAASPGYLTAGKPLLGGTHLTVKDEGRTEIRERVTLHGAIPLPAPNQWVTVSVQREGRMVRTRNLPTDPVTGKFGMRLKLRGCCEYLANVSHGSDAPSAAVWEARVPLELQPGDRLTRLFNRLLARNGYHMPDEIPSEEDEATGLAIMALRKVHEMPRTEAYDPALFELLLRGDARFQPLHTDDGRHVEVDVSRQVMALVEDGRATDVFHVSTGAGGTPTGEWGFYDKGPGYNAKGMYYSVYYDGNYATHGYSSVPTYPASHGCTRNSIAYAVYVYDWIELGDTIYVYS